MTTKEAVKAFMANRQTTMWPIVITVNGESVTMWVQGKIVGITGASKRYLNAALAAEANLQGTVPYNEDWVEII